MSKIKLFSNIMSCNVENEVNDFLEKTSVTLIDIKYNVDNGNHYIVVVYETNPEEETEKGNEEADGNEWEEKETVIQTKEKHWF